MNVFILSTGRCGSVTFIKACKHITNYSCSHESRCTKLGESRVDYPVDHIEADNRLSWFLGRLDEKYGNNALYIHLKRNDLQTARSYAEKERYHGGIMKAYRGMGILLEIPEDTDPMSIAIDYCDTVNSNINLFLKDKTNKMIVNLENIDQDFRVFWELIKAKGDMEAALSEFKVNYNATKEVVNKNKKDYAVVKVLKKLKRILFKLPVFIKDA
ncbi:hypothetical protein [Methylotuvimicrobium sp. KM1]|uniref:hypothetical protein n=1 Tax=Methylotuvimicrobium sp. KM1 TaxID=3377707 RepID=UPI00384EC80A